MCFFLQKHKLYAWNNMSKEKMKWGEGKYISMFNEMKCATLQEEVPMQQELE